MQSIKIYKRSAVKGSKKKKKKRLNLSEKYLYKYFLLFSPCVKLITKKNKKFEFSIFTVNFSSMKTSVVVTLRFKRIFDLFWYWQFHLLPHFFSFEEFVEEICIQNCLNYSANPWNPCLIMPFSNYSHNPIQDI